VLRTLARALRPWIESNGDALDEEQLLATGNEIHQQLAALARARATAHANVRIAPRRWRLRTVVDAENRRTAQLHLLGSATLGLLRTFAMAPPGVPSSLARPIGVLMHAIEQLAANERPWPEDTRRQVVAAIGELRRYAGDQGSTAPAILRAAAGDLARLIGLGPAATLREPVPA
jgi:hypothetical protein